MFFSKSKTDLPTLRAISFTRLKSLQYKRGVNEHYLKTLRNTLEFWAVTTDRVTDLMHSRTDRMRLDARLFEECSTIPVIESSISQQGFRWVGDSTLTLGVNESENSLFLYLRPGMRLSRSYPAAGHLVRGKKWMDGQMNECLKQ